MIANLVEDSLVRPDLFIWRGRLPHSAIEDWERQRRTRAPEELKELWSMMGGGDLFESETILQPFGAKDPALIEPVSELFWSRGLDTGFFVFHTGARDSVFRKSDGELFSLSPTDPSQMSSFQNLDEWYQALRTEYAERYQLAARR